MAEPGSELIRDTMDRPDAWFICRVGFVEIARAVGLAAGASAAARFRDEWHAFSVIEVDHDLCDRAAALALESGLGSLDALHLAAALLLPHEELTMATWDGRLHEAGARVGLEVLPARLD